MARLVEEMYLAKKSRTIPHYKKRTDLKEEQRFVASRIGTLFSKSLGMIDEIQMAMLARGFHGEIQVIHQFTLRKADYFWLGGTILIIIGISWLTVMGRF